MTEKVTESGKLDLSNSDQERSKRKKANHFYGVVIGVLVGLHDEATPFVVFPGNPREESVPARTTHRWSQDDIGCQVALLFEGGDPARPLVIGRIQNPKSAQLETQLEKTPEPVSVSLDGEQLTLSAEREFVLRCGKASITLTRAGKVLIRGAYVLSRSSGVNRIKGGSVQIN